MSDEVTRQTMLLAKAAELRRARENRTKCLHRSDDFGRSHDNCERIIDELLSIIDGKPNAAAEKMLAAANG